ncbi:GntR family transcriptional regulator [Aureibacillus halotolerans]|uniref:GntR family transcriptional regulator n=1 Tax=Aureibacillus halotolerans TaxID=1508390 RepID=A0A4R6U966_9BACI|nr:GntR family transcriptional regulator [Aureibacillus halotolerans]TDQ41215.1 GntR family transcriptional regulator [Aureibacillus halotolerans]
MEKSKKLTANGEALYSQIKRILIQRIKENVWKPNTLIPTEQELMDEFEVSRTTIRQAIAILVQMDLLEKKQGRGTIVRPQKLVGSLGQLKGFAEEVLEKGKTPKSKVIRAEFKTMLFPEKEILSLDEKENVYLIERIRFADDMPIAFERTCWPEEIGKVLSTYDLDQAQYYPILEEHGYHLKKAHEKISAINATVYEADYLGIRPGEALLEMTRLSYGIDGQPIEYTCTKYRSDQYHYDIELER